jgi:hypothetical protein
VVLELFTVTEDGLNEAVTLAGKPEEVRTTVFGVLSVVATVTVTPPEVPWVTVMLAGAVTVKFVV